MEVILNPGRVTANFIIMHESGGVPAPAGDPNVIKTSQGFHLHYDWTQTGPLFDLAFPGTWELKILFEKMGTAEGPGDISTNVPYVVNTPAGNRRYHDHLIVSAAQAPGAGVYRVVAQLSLLSGGRVIATGFEDMGIKQFYPG